MQLKSLLSKYKERYIENIQNYGTAILIILKRLQIKCPYAKYIPLCIVFSVLHNLHF